MISLWQDGDLIITVQRLTTVGIKDHPYKLEAAAQLPTLVDRAANMLYRYVAKSGTNHTSAKKELKIDLILTCR